MQLRTHRRVNGGPEPGGVSRLTVNEGERLGLRGCRTGCLFGPSLRPPSLLTAPRRSAILAGGLGLGASASAIDLLSPLRRPIRLHALALRLPRLGRHPALALRLRTSLLRLPLRPIRLHALANGPALGGGHRAALANPRGRRGSAIERTRCGSRSCSQIRKNADNGSSFLCNRVEASLSTRPGELMQFGSRHWRSFQGSNILQHPDRTRQKPIGLKISRTRSAVGHW
jgi:hypothetical protein